MVRLKGWRNEERGSVHKKFSSRFSIPPHLLDGYIRHLKIAGSVCQSVINFAKLLLSHVANLLHKMGLCGLLLIGLLGSNAPNGNQSNILFFVSFWIKNWLSLTPIFLKNRPLITIWDLSFDVVTTKLIIFWMPPYVFYFLQIVPCEVTFGDNCVVQTFIWENILRRTALNRNYRVSWKRLF